MPYLKTVRTGPYTGNTKKAYCIMGARHASGMLHFNMEIRSESGTEQGGMDSAIHRFHR